MYRIESLINGRWVQLSRKTYTKERAQSLVANLIDEVTIAEAGEEYRYVPA